MARMSASGSPWGIVVLGVVMTALGALFVAAPDAVDVGDPDILGRALLGGGPAVAAFGVGAVRRQGGRHGGRVWTVLGFVLLAVTLVVVGIGVLGVVLAGASIVAAGVTISRGALARRMSAVEPAAASTAERRRRGSTPFVPLQLEVLDADAVAVDSARIDRLQRPLSGRGVRMLYLWVFDERTNDGLIERWRNVGPVQLLRGGGALGGVRTLAATVTGRIGDLIEETADEVESRLAGFEYERTDGGRFAVNTILCSDGTWQVALNELIASTDVVQMDLGGFDEDNQGCAHELGLLVDRVPLERVLLVLDDSTDVPLLRRVLEESWSRMDEASPNRDPGRGPLTAVKAPIVGLPPGSTREFAEHVERQELAVFHVMLERAARV
jgi:hypothetical protein